MPGDDTSDRAPAPPKWGLGDAVAGAVVGYGVSLVALLAWIGASGLRPVHGRYPQTTGTVVVGLVGLWVGLAGAAVWASRRKGTSNLGEDFGLRLRWWPDLPLGVAVGMASQYVLLWVVYLPVRPFVHHFDQTLSQPAQQLTGGSSGASLALVAVLVVIGSAVVEELYFRGLLLRALERRLVVIGPRRGPAASVLVSAALFGLAHSEALQFLGLFAFGVVLAVLARATGRLGPGVVAHATFNLAAVVSIVVGR